LKYTDEDGKEKSVVMGCYGFGPSRVMGTLAEIFNDDHGLIWPESVAPYQVHLINLKNNLADADKLYKTLQTKGVEVLYDDRLDVRPGEKLAEADLIGIPHRLVISEKTQDKIEYSPRNRYGEAGKNRKDLEAKLITEKELFDILEK